MEFNFKNPKLELVFKYFEEISKIPRGSGNEKGISDYLAQEGRRLGLEVIQDETLNVIIKKEASEGYENSPAVILQGHMDMVCEKNKDVDHDFSKDPIELEVKGDYLYAKGTTLGADNGIAVAMGLALLASGDIATPKLEVLFTVNEEVSMEGAMNLDGSVFDGRYIINLDSEEEGCILVGCAGGNRNCTTLPLEFKSSEKQGFLIELKGLLGGHSGMEIDKNHANSNKLMGRILDLLTVDYDLVNVNGGLKTNAIPRECDAVIAVDTKDIDQLKSELAKIESIFKHEYRIPDPDVKIELSETSFEKVLTDECKNKVIQLLNLIPSGIQTMAADMPGLVESSINLGVVTTKENVMTFEATTRSSVETRKDYINNTVKLVAESLGADYEETDHYPSWERAIDSKLEEISIETYKKLTGNDPKILTIHAGLECGLFLKKMDGCEAISIGPNAYDVHTPNEHVSISSIKNVWDYLVACLESMNQH